MSKQRRFKQTRSNLTVVSRQLNNPKEKPNNYSDGQWNEWISHFNLCADINQWNNTQRCQQLAVSLRGRAQRIFLSLNEEEKATFEESIAVQNTTRSSEKDTQVIFQFREMGEDIVDLVTSLRGLHRQRSRPHGGRIGRPVR